MAAAEKTLAQKLLLKPGTKLATLNAPKGAPPIDGTKRASIREAEAALVYATTAKELDAALPEIAKSAAEARVWVAYPKAGKLGTDLNRDTLAGRLEAHGFEPCRQVALDDTWSAMWFKR